jgi:hypothetical protein
MYYLIIFNRVDILAQQKKIGVDILVLTS